jgi:hypothetical protein
VAGTDATDAHGAVEATHEEDAAGHGHADHGDAGGHDAGHSQEPLGPIDWRAWGAGAVGAVAAVVVAGALYLSAHPS